jgi:glycosyltransferase involved in cell wall biosynthesis
MLNKLSIVIPCYNERYTILQVLDSLLQLDLGLEKQIIIVDDGSTDGTTQLLQEIDYPDVKFIFHAVNQGKGAAIQTALSFVTGDFVIIQDADLEYSPQDIKLLIQTTVKTAAPVVYGSRNLHPTARGQFVYYWGGVFLSKLANILYRQNLTDIATGYKLIRTDIITDCRLTERGFGFCYEITAKLALKQVKITEVPISYRPRSRAEGKKISAKDGLEAIWLLLRYRFFYRNR